MIEGNEYIEIVKRYFSFLTIECGFKISEEEIRGNAFYDVQYKDKTRLVSISYENIEDYFITTIFLLQNGELPQYDDKSRTLPLKSINTIIHSTIDKNELTLNNQFFSKFRPKTEMEKKLLKSAKELRLCLKNFEKLNII